jgi:hypothetical protein
MESADTSNRVDALAMTSGALPNFWITPLAQCCLAEEPQCVSALGNMMSARHSDSCGMRVMS